MLSQYVALKHREAPAAGELAMKRAHRAAVASARKPQASDEADFIKSAFRAQFAARVHIEK